MKLLGLVIGIIAFLLVLLGALKLISNKKPYYINEGFADTYPTTPDIKNPLSKIIKKITKLSSYFADPTVWSDVYRTSQMSLAELARENIKKERLLLQQKQ
jgi:hypothetical protein